MNLALCGFVVYKDGSISFHVEEFFYGEYVTEKGDALEKSIKAQVSKFSLADYMRHFFKWYEDKEDADKYRISMIDQIME
jgi:hypothetical protein